MGVAENHGVLIDLARTRYSVFLSNYKILAPSPVIPPSAVQLLFYSSSASRCIFLLTPYIGADSFYVFCLYLSVYSSMTVERLDNLHTATEYERVKKCLLYILVPYHSRTQCCSLIVMFQDFVELTL